MIKELDETKKILAIQIKQLREDKNISVEELSKTIRLTKKWIIKSENGKAHLDWYCLFKLAKFYNKKVVISFED